MRRRLLFTALIWGVFISHLAACDSAIEPVADGAHDVFAIHGVLLSDADTQYVRIEALRPVASEPATDPDDVIVHSADDQGEDVVQWQGHEVIAADGRPSLVFEGVFRPVAGRRYTVSIEADGSGVTTAATRVPPVPGIRSFPASGDTLSNAYIKTIHIEGVPQGPQRIDVWYELQEDAESEPVRYYVPYGTSGSQSGNAWRVQLFLNRDRAELLRQLGRSFRDRTVRLVRTGAIVSLLSEEWSVQDPEPGVTGGHGLLASIGRHEVVWRLGPTEPEMAGFVDAQSGR